MAERTKLEEHEQAEKEAKKIAAKTYNNMDLPELKNALASNRELLKGNFPSHQLVANCEYIFLKIKQLEAL